MLNIEHQQQMNAEDVKRIRGIFRLTQEELARKIGVTRNTIINYEKGGVIPDSKRKLLASLESQSNLAGESDVTPVPEDDYMMVEFEDLETAAGILGGGNIETLPEKKKRLVPKEYAKGLYLVVRVHGHSMDDGTKRSITEGEELLIKEYFGDIGNAPIRNKLFVVVTNEGSVVKQIIDKSTDLIVCHSFNPAWEDYSIKVDEILQIFTVEKKVKSNIIF